MSITETSVVINAFNISTIKTLENFFGLDGIWTHDLYNAWQCS